MEILSFPLSQKYQKKQAASSPVALYNQLALHAKASGFRISRTQQYVGACEWLMLYGPGGLDRVDPMTRHTAKGGHVICWDAAYWQRKQRLRVSIDHAHPQAYVMRRDWPPDRLSKDGIKLTDRWNPNGPVIVASIGAKARAQYGTDVVAAWEQRVVTACRQRWPDARILYRPKPAHPVAPPLWASLAPTGPIDAVLDGARLVATWHSNVAVDAIRLGIPVVCQDGAAAAVACQWIPEVVTPLPDDVRRRFLTNLAWFQWAPHEARACWKFLRTLLVK